MLSSCPRSSWTHPLPSAVVRLPGVPVPSLASSGLSTCHHSARRAPQLGAVTDTSPGLVHAGGQGHDISHQVCPLHLSTLGLGNDCRLGEQTQSQGGDPGWNRISGAPHSNRGPAVTLWASGYQRQREPYGQQSLSALTCPLPWAQFWGHGEGLASARCGLVCCCSALPEHPSPLIPGLWVWNLLMSENWVKDHALLLGLPGHASLMSSLWTLVRSPRTLCSVHHRLGTSGPWLGCSLAVSTRPLVARCRPPHHCQQTRPGASTDLHTTQVPLLVGSWWPGSMV